MDIDAIERLIKLRREAEDDIEKELLEEAIRKIVEEDSRPSLPVTIPPAPTTPIPSYPLPNFPQPRIPDPPAYQPYWFNKQTTPVIPMTAPNIVLCADI